MDEIKEGFPLLYYFIATNGSFLLILKTRNSGTIEEIDLEKVLPTLPPLPYDTNDEERGKNLGLLIVRHII